jgi:mannose-6-phosphate isomerase
VAGEWGGEPKSEMWYVVDREPGAKLYVGCREGVREEDFRKAVEDEANLEEYVGVLRPEPGDFIYIPSGRLHAIGAGLLIYEIQQNSDTTYRVYDWGRKGLDGNPRELHVEESLRSIDFEDEAPKFGDAKGDRLVDCEHFVVERWTIQGMGVRSVAHPAEAVILSVVAGVVECGGETFREGDFFLVPASAQGSARTLTTELGVVLLATFLPGAA